MRHVERPKMAWAVAAVLGAGLVTAAYLSPPQVPLWLALALAALGAAPVGVILGWALAQLALRIRRPKGLVLEPAADTNAR